MKGSKIVMGIDDGGKSVGYKISDKLIMSYPIGYLFPEVDKAYPPIDAKMLRHEVSKQTLS